MRVLILFISLNFFSLNVFAQINWKNYFTLQPEEGISFTLDTTITFINSSVPVLNIASNNSIILVMAGQTGPKAYEVQNNGRIYNLLQNFNRPLDGAFIYLPDGRIRFLFEFNVTPPNDPNIKHRSRIESFISNDGINWQKESGVRYYPTIEDDSIASVPCAIQVQDSIWRMYYVGDWYRTNGIRTAISYDWGLNWQAESINNILRDGDVDPHIVYLSNGKYRLYFRSGMKRPPDQAGISYCDSYNGISFDTNQIHLIYRDIDKPGNLLKLDPAVIKFPNGDIACYVGAVPPPPQSGESKLLLFWGNKSINVERLNEIQETKDFIISTAFPNPFNSETNVQIYLIKDAYLRIKLFDTYGKELKNIDERIFSKGNHHLKINCDGLSSGLYLLNIFSNRNKSTLKLLLIK